jgi:hypothetical protein
MMYLTPTEWRVLIAMGACAWVFIVSLAVVAHAIGALACTGAVFC